MLIYVPSIARFRASYLEARIAAAHLASLSVDLGERLACRRSSRTRS